jgi:hypothetical protein
MAPKKATILFVVLVISALVLTVVSSGALSALSNLTGTAVVPSSGQVTSVQTSINLGIYQNSACTADTVSVNWGALHPGENTTQTLWIKNIGSTDATLSLSATGWTPSQAPSALELSWDGGGKTLVPGEVIQATLTLSVASTIDASITNFSFDIQITGTA